MTLPENIIIERYRYILEQKKALNARTFVIVGIAQAVGAGAVTAHLVIIREAAGSTLPLEAAVMASWVLFGIFASVCVTAIMLIASGMASWMRYRREEFEMEREILNSTQDPISLMSLFRWYETYFAALLLTAVLAYYVVTDRYIIPLLMSFSSHSLTRLNPYFGTI